MSEPKLAYSREVAVLEQLRTAPNLYSWKWDLPGGATIKVDAIGRWSAAEAEQMQTVLGLIAGILKDGADPVRPKPAEAAIDETGA